MKKPFFILVAAGTELSNIEGLSAAGKDTQAQKLTPSLDAEFIIHGKTLSASGLPISPEGIISPAIISKACLNILDAEIRIVNAGCFHPIKGMDSKSYFDFELEPAKDISKEDAFSFEECESIFLDSTKLLDRFGFDKNKHELIVAECVVGGTTTALALLKLLGYDALNYISSSFKDNNARVKKRVIDGLLRRVEIYDLSKLESSLYLTALAGDKAQTVITALALSAMQQEIKTTLAGGTQMLAIYALIQAMTRGFFMKELLEVRTSPWLIKDKSSDAVGLAKLIDKELELKYRDDIVALNSILSKEIDKFSGYPSWIDIKELYDQGYVKEGVGMGALLSLVKVNSLSI